MKKNVLTICSVLFIFSCDLFFNPFLKVDFKEGFPSVVITNPTGCGIIPSKEGLVSYYPFNGNANDESGIDNHGIVHGAALTTDRFGDPDSAYYFDGNDYIRASSTNLPSGERTVSLWFNANSASNRPMCLGYGGSSCGNSWFMGINHGGQQSFHMSNHCGVNRINYYYSQAPIQRWYHYVITTDTTGTKIYVDGELMHSNGTYVNNTYVSGRHLSIGVITSTTGYAPYTDANVNYMRGKIDDVRIYNRALSACEIEQLYYEKNDLTFSGIIDFSCTAFDLEDGELEEDSLVWTSSIDGQIGIGKSFFKALSLGDHVITVSVADSQGNVSRSSINIKVICSVD